MDVVAAVGGPGGGLPVRGDPAAGRGRRRWRRRRRSGQRGPGRGDAAECAIAHAMGRAELAWRRALAVQNLDEIRQRAQRQAPEAPDRLRTRDLTGPAV